MMAAAVKRTRDTKGSGAPGSMAEFNMTVSINEPNILAKNTAVN